MSRPSPAVSRSPSVSRASPPASRPSAPMANRPSAGARPSTGNLSSPGARPSPGTRPSTGGLPVAGTRPGTGGLPSAGTRPSTGARPSRGDLQNFLDVPKPSTGAIAGAGSRPGGSNLGAAVGAGVAGGAAAEFLQNRGGPSAGQLPAAGTRPAAGQVANRAAERGDLAGNRPERIENRQERQQNRTERRDEIRDQVRENHPRLDFWADHPNWAAWRINRPYRWATWGAIAGWVGYGWSEPAAYSYGDNVYYEGDSVYYGDQKVASAEEYTQQAEQIASSAPQVAPDKAEWMPLGVFALTPDGQASGPDPSLFLQLAISKEGIISGNLNNSATNSTQTIEGMADKASQRVAWTVAGKTRPIMETGINNLTDDTAPALVHFADGQTQQWLMVRLEEPKS
jgi:hypothetical protein